MIIALLKLGGLASGIVVPVAMGTPGLVLFGLTCFICGFIVASPLTEMRRERAYRAAKAARLRTVRTRGAS